MPVSELTDCLWGYTCVAGYFIAAFIVLLAAFFTAVLVLPCHVDLSFQPSPARW